MNTIRVTVAWAAEDEGGEIELELPAGSSVQNAIDAAGDASPGMAKNEKLAIAIGVGVWGKVRSRDFHLRDGDRVELYRALKADPKDARRVNAQRSSVKSGKM